MKLTRRQFVKMAAVSAAASFCLPAGFAGLAAAGTAPAQPSAPGMLRLVPGQANPAGDLERLYLVMGDAHSAPVTAIDTAGADYPAAGLAAGRTVTLKLFHFNDLHNNLTIPHAKKGDSHIFSQMYKQVAAARAAAGPDDAVLFVSAGDDHTGAVFDELVGWDEKTFVMSPSYRIYSAGGLDLAVIGNHELDRGAAVLAKSIHADARFPLLSANLHGSRHLAGTDYFPAAIGLVKGLRVGFIGLTTPVDTHTGEAADPGLAVAGTIRTVTNLLPALSKLCDVVVILSHSGFGEATGAAERNIAEGDVAIAKAAARLTDKPLIIVGGHTHTALNTNGLTPDTLIEGVPIVQAGGKGQFLGEVTASLATEGSKPVMTGTAAALIALKQRDDRVKPDDPKYATLEHDGDFDRDFEATVIAPIMARLKNRLDEPLARVEGAPQVGTEATVASRYTGENVLADFMNDAVVARSSTYPGGPVDIALLNASGVNSGIPAEGEVTFSDWYNVMPFADSVQIGTMTGRQLKDMLVNNAKRLVRPEELTGASPVDLKGYVSRGFLHFSGAVRYTLKLNGSASEATATGITIKGEPIDKVLDKTFTVAFNSYVGAGAYGEAWNGQTIGAGITGEIVGYDLKSLPKNDTFLVYRNEIVRYIQEKGVISPETGAKTDGRLTVVQ